MPGRRPAVHVASNPALAGVLLRLRDRGTDRERFRELMELAGILLGYEAARFLRTREDSAETPLGAVARVERAADEDLVVVAVLRAALPMALGVLRLFPRASLGFVAAARLEDTARREAGRLHFDVDMAYWKLPPVEGKDVLLVDPMLATGSTLSRIAARIVAEKPARVVVVSLIAARQGIEVVSEALGGVESAIVVAAVDPELDQRGFIVPGLGDAGDRSFG
ncbi:MAG: uracil phosphoribosyltransferase [Thermoproteota archaeon]